MRLATKLRDVFYSMPIVAAGEAAGLKIFSRGADPDFARGTYEFPIQEAIASLLAPGDVFYDVGANIGFFSLIAARRVGPHGQVYAYEPVPRNATAIGRSRDVNRLNTIQVFTEAVGAVTGDADLLLAHHLGGATLATVSTPPDMNGRLRVRTTTLDDSIATHGLRPPTLVKIDVEGAEIHVLRGMTAALTAYHPKVICEVDAATKSELERKAREIIEFLATAGYAVSSLPAAYANDGWKVEHILAAHDDVRRSLLLHRHDWPQTAAEAESGVVGPEILVADNFQDERARGAVIGTLAVKGGVRRGRDIEHQIAIDHGALRFQPLVRPGWGRQGISYGPFQREAGLVLLVSITNGHNTSQGSPLPDDFARRVYRWLRGPGIDPWPGRLMSLIRAPRKRSTLRRLWWWMLSTPRTYRGPNINENLAVGWFPSEAPVNPVEEGCGFVVHAAEGENGELWARVGKQCLSAFRRLKNLHIYYVVALREQGAIYYAAADQKAHGLAAFPMMRPIAIDPFNKDEKLFAGVHQSALGQIGFRVDTRVQAVHVGWLPEFSTVFGTAHAADAHVEGLPAQTAVVGGRWRFLQDAGDNLSIVDPGHPSGLIHGLLEIGAVSDVCGLVWRFRDKDNFWLLKLSTLGCTLVSKQSGKETTIATNPGHALRECSTHSVQILDCDGQVSCFLDGIRLFDVAARADSIESATGVGIWKSFDSEPRWHSFEAHPCEVPIPLMAPLEAHWNQLGTTLSYADDFTGTAGELDRRTTELGGGQWARTLGTGVIDVDGLGSARVRASVDRPNPGRTFYSLPWDLPGFSDLEVTIKPPGERRGQDQRSRAGLLFWQDSDNYVCVTTWLDDVYQGASISVFIKRLGFEELYDAVWTNVADKVVWGKRFRMRVAFDGNRFAILIDDEPVMQRSLTDIYPEDAALQILRVGLAVNWEWGDDTGSAFTSFKARR